MGIQKKILKRAEKQPEEVVPVIAAPQTHLTDKLPWRAALRERCAEMRALDERQRAERLAAASHLEPIFTTSDTYVPPAMHTHVALPHETNVPLEFLGDAPAAQEALEPITPALVADTYQADTYETELFEEPTPVVAVAPIMLAGADEPEHFFDESFTFEQTPVPEATHKHYISSLSLHEEETAVLNALKPVTERTRTGAPATAAPKPALSASAISALANRSRRTVAPVTARKAQRNAYTHSPRTFIGAF